MSDIISILVVVILAVVFGYCVWAWNMQALKENAKEKEQAAATKQKKKSAPKKKASPKKKVKHTEAELKKMTKDKIIEAAKAHGVTLDKKLKKEELISHYLKD